MVEPVTVRAGADWRRILFHRWYKLADRSVLNGTLKRLLCRCFDGDMPEPQPPGPGNRVGGAVGSCNLCCIARCRRVKRQIFISQYWCPNLETLGEQLLGAVR